MCDPGCVGRTAYEKRGDVQRFCVQRETPFRRMAFPGLVYAGAAGYYGLY